MARARRRGASFILIREPFGRGIPSATDIDAGLDVGLDVGLAPDLQRQVVNYPTNAAPYTVVIDTEHTYLYYVLGDGKAIRTALGVGRDASNGPAPRP